MRTAAFFDLDKTIIAKSSTLAFGRSFYQGGLINRRAVLKTAYAQFVYLVGGADHDQMERMRQYLSSLCTGWDVGQVREIVAETLHDLIDPLIFGFLFAILLLPICSFFETKLRFPRSIASLASILMLIAFIGSILYLVGSQISHLADDWPMLRNRWDSLSMI